MKPKKPRKPRLAGWSIFFASVFDDETPGIMHNKSGRFWLGTKNLRKIGTFFIKAADYLEAKSK